MSLKKPILKVTRKCPDCKGSGKKKSKFLGGACYSGFACPRCAGLGRLDVERNNPNFKKYYQINLEEKVDFLTAEYRHAKSKAAEMGEELRMNCKELDKVVNK